MQEPTIYPHRQHPPTAPMDKVRPLSNGELHYPLSGSYAEWCLHSVKDHVLAAISAQTLKEAQGHLQFVIEKCQDVSEYITAAIISGSLPSEDDD